MAKKKAAAKKKPAKKKGGKKKYFFFGVARCLKAVDHSTAFIFFCT